MVPAETLCVEASNLSLEQEGRAYTKRECLAGFKIGNLSFGSSQCFGVQRLLSSGVLHIEMNQNTEYKRKSISRLFVAAGLGLASLASPARSQEADGNSMYELEGFTVVANRTELPLDRVGSSVDVLDATYLEADQSTFLLDSLRGVAGLNLRNNGGPGGAFGMTVRGLNSNRPKVLIDGVEVSNPATGSIINFGNLVVSNVNKVEVLKGPQSSLYGADAIAGVINIETLRDFSSNEGRLRLSAGSFGTYEGSLSYRGTTDALRYSFGVNRYESDGFSTQDPALGEAWADDDAYENTSLNASVVRQVGEKSEVSFSAYYNENYSEFDPGDPAFIWGEPFAGSFSEGKQLFAKLGFKSEISDAWKTRIDYALTDVETLNKFGAGAPSLSEGKRHDLNWQNTLKASESWDLVAGAQFKRDEDRLAGRSRDDLAVYVESVHAISKDLDWTLGGRFDDNEDYGSEATFRSTFSYRIPETATRLRGSFGTSFQAPSFFQLSETNGFGNPNLGPETGSGWDFGVEHQFAESKLSVGLTYFGYDIENKIIWDSSATSEARPWGTYANRELYKSQGLETSLKWQASDSFGLGLVHTYVSAEYGDGTEAERAPRNTASLIANWTALENALTLNAIVQHTGSQFSLRGADVKQASYTVLDLAASYRIDDSYSVWLRVDNALDEDYEEILSYQTAGASVFGGLRYSF